MRENGRMIPFQYSIRWVILFVTVLALTFGYFARTTKSQKVAKQVHTLSGSIDIHPRGPSWIRTAFGKHVGEIVIGPLDSIIAVNLGARGGALSGPPTKVSDDWLTLLSGLRSLRELSVSETRVTDEGIAHLRDLPQLSSVNLAWTKISDSTIRQISGLSSIVNLDLSGTAISDEGLADLQRLPKLRRLQLNNTGITDRGMVYLRKVPGLELLSIFNTRITREGIMQLKNDLPRCHVRYN